MRVFYATDIHGSDVCFRKFLNTTKVYGAEVLVLGGDITGKTITPIIHESSIYRCQLLGEEIVVHGGEELEKLKRRVRDLGSYPYVTSHEGFHVILEDHKSKRKLFEDLIVESIREWIKLADEKLRSIRNVECYISPGNDDIHSIDEILNESERVINPNERVLEILGGYEMLSLGYANKTPWNCPRDLSEDELSRRLSELGSKVMRPETTIFNIHVPPYGSGLDEAPELDEDLRPRLEPGGRFKMVPVGSKAVRDAITVLQPLLGLHGHVHESKGFARVGRTLCLNPGSEYQEGVLRGVLLQLDGKKVKDFIFTSG
ncbi:MAG: metallophosphoesterase [Candidatus Bathyarchaeia archaeon]|nr:metallophosphoesterase [Candidatus Bathyarchaeota archaeon]